MKSEGYPSIEFSNINNSTYWIDPEPVTASELKKIQLNLVVSPNVMNEEPHAVLIAPHTKVYNFFIVFIRLHLYKRRADI